MAKRPDYILIGVTIILLILGILVLASVSAPISQEKFGTTYYFLGHQILFGVIPGLILAFIFFKISLNFLKKWVLILFLTNLVLLAMVFLPGIGVSFGGATRWISLGPISFQPSEFLKLTFILYLASWLNSQTSVQKPNQTLIAFLILLSIIGLLLYFQPDISTFGVIALSAFLMYFLAGTPLWHSILIFFSGLSSLFILIKAAPYRLARWLVFLQPGTDPMGIGYQIKQSLLAVGSGGILGLGLGMSLQKFGLLPHPMSDAIFAILSEETGFVGATILVCLFLIFFWRGFKISKEANNKFSQLAALGITCWITLQAFFNISSMLGLLPLTGIPLPFISYGGSHLVAELIAVGVLLNISRSNS